MDMRILIGISGSSGVTYGVRMLEVLKILKIETHLMLSKWADECIKIETNKLPSYVKSLADYVYDNNDLAAKPSSGSYKIDGMVSDQNIAAMPEIPNMAPTTTRALID